MEDVVENVSYMQQMSGNTQVTIMALVCRTLTQVTQLAQASLTQKLCTTQALQSNCKQINYDIGWGLKNSSIYE